MANNDTRSDPVMIEEGEVEPVPEAAVVANDDGQVDDSKAKDEEGTTPLNATNTNTATTTPRKSPANLCIYGIILLALVAAVVVPTTVHVVKKKNEKDKVHYTPLYDTSSLPLY